MQLTDKAHAASPAAQTAGVLVAAALQARPDAGSTLAGAAHAAVQQTADGTEALPSTMDLSLPNSEFFEAQLAARLQARQPALQSQRGPPANAAKKIKLEGGQGTAQPPPQLAQVPPKSVPKVASLY